jgi:hypothetical protein
MGFTWHKNRCKLHRAMALVFGIAYQGKDIVFRLIIKYSSLRDFGTKVVGLFSYEDF